MVAMRVTVSVIMIVAMIRIVMVVVMMVVRHCGLCLTVGEGGQCAT